MIYRYSYYYNPPNTHYLSKVSRAHGVSWADKIEFQKESYPNEHVLGVYWGYQKLYLVNGSDITPPDRIDWMGGNETSSYDFWSVSWWNSYDLNTISYYELQVSNTLDFSNPDIYYANESTTYSSYEFSDMEHGTYYYRIRAIDTMEHPNYGEWSEILKIVYSEEETPGNPLNPFIIPGYHFLIIIMSSIITIGVIIKKKIKS